MQITTGIAHGTDVIHSHAGTPRSQFQLRKQSPACRRVYSLLARLSTPFLDKVRPGQLRASRAQVLAPFGCTGDTQACRAVYRPGPR
jgi:hypothetical protein